MKMRKIISKAIRDFINENRERYNSLFLTNFRNSTKAYSRKRISFDVAYKLISWIIEKELTR